MHTDPPRQGPNRRLLEVLLAFAATVLGILGLTLLGSLHTLLQENIQALAAILFIGLPWWILRREGTDPATFGIRFDRLTAQAWKACLVALVVFPPFILGNHLVETQHRERALAVDDHALWRWPLVLEGRPHPLPAPQGFVAWTERDTLTLLWTAPPRGEDRTIALQTDHPPEEVRIVHAKNNALLKGARCPSPIAQPAPDRVEVTSTCAAGIRVDLGNAREIRLRLDAERDADPDVRIGAFLLEAGDASDLSFDRTVWWFLQLLLIHIVLVGIPEEVFYRGYIQTRLQQWLPPRWKLFGVSIGPALIAASVLFALGHFLIDLNPWRLLVFFPSLLFGWIRNWTGVIGAAAFFHGMCNVLQQVLLGIYI